MDFYCLGSPLLLAPQFGNTPIYGTVDWYEKYRNADDQGTSYESIRCSLNPGHRRAGPRIGNLRLQLPTSHIGDFIWTVLSEGVVTESVLSLFRENNLSGYRTRDASIARIKGRKKDDTTPLSTFWELEITGKGGEAHPDSGIRLLSVCPECKLKRYSSFRNGIIVDESQWDGSDIFVVNGYKNYWLVTARVKDLVVRSKLTNCVIILSSDLKWGKYPKPEEPPKFSTAPVKT